MSEISKENYIGRFAPSPTGPLHFGSLVAAVASYLCARNNNGKWLLRIEDVDTTRRQKGATDAIINTLIDYGFEWDGEITYQNLRSAHYDDALLALKEVTYPCSCTRKELQAVASTGKFSYVYPNICRQQPVNPGKDQFSIRLRSDQKSRSKQPDVIELCQPNALQQNIETEVGDFILKRSDGLFSYQLAVVVDDALQGITDIVRGADLFDNTPRQRYLQGLLSYQQPQYLHFPVAVTASGKKLSKQNLSPAISSKNTIETLLKTLSFLGQKPPARNQFSSLSDLWVWAVQNWDYTLIPKQLTIQYDPLSD